MAAAPIFAAIATAWCGPPGLGLAPYLSGGEIADLAREGVGRFEAGPRPLHLSHVLRGNGLYRARRRQHQVHAFHL